MGAQSTAGEGDPLAPGGAGLAASAAQTGAQTGRPETARLLLFAPRDVTRLLRAALCTVRRRIERARGRMPTQGEAFGVILSHALATWEASEGRTPPAHRVFERDGWRCTVPGCSSYRNLHDHHVVFRSAGGSDALANRTTLCAWHHLRGVHGGIVGVSGRAPEGLRFRLGLRAEGPPLARYGPGERLAEREC